MLGSKLPVIYGNGLRITQNPDSVAISYEMIHDTRVIPLDGRGIPGSAIVAKDLSVAEGAFFNQRLAEIESSAVHNRFLTEALLLSSMQAVQDQYGIAPSMAPADIEKRLREITR